MNDTESGGPVYLVNFNEGEQAVIHDPMHLTERCNTDQIEGREKVDSETADALTSMGEARRCQQCLGDNPPT